MGIFSALGSAYNVLMGLSKSQSGFYIPAQAQFDLQKAQTQEKPTREPKAAFYDPTNLVNAMDYKDRSLSLSYQVLKRMAQQNSVVSSIVNTRVNQVSTFTRPARFDPMGIGFEIRLRDPNEHPSEKDRKAMIALEEFIERTGYDNDPERDSFDTFIRKLVRDRLTYDQVTFEIQKRRNGLPFAFHAVDASTIRIASENIMESVSTNEAGIEKNEKVKYVQVIHGEVHAYFSGDELAFGVANPRSDINIAPYGYSELEMLIRIITSHLNTEEYNSRYFTQGGTSKGVINLAPSTSDANGVGTMGIPDEQLEAFKRQWQAQVSGVMGAWKTPVVSVPKLEYVTVGHTNQEMEFEKWLNYLINIACAVYQIDPAEINFPNRGGSTGHGAGGLGEGGIEDRIKHSRDKGLRPLLRFLESMINRYIVSKFDDRFVFAFVGMDAKSENEILDFNKKEAETYKTVNEIRKQRDLEPIVGGDVILNPVFLQSYQFEKGQEMGEHAHGDNEENIFGDFDDGESTGNLDEEDVSEQNDNKEKVVKSLTKFLTIELDND